MLHALIIAGGSGTRFWPESRKAKPKQFLRFTGERSLIQATWDRLDGLVDTAHRWVVCGKAHAALVQADLPQLPHLILEPLAKNTAPAIALGVREILKHDPQATVVVLPADHYVRDADAFRKTLHIAAQEAQAHGGVVTLGIKATRAETGFGYIERAAALRENVFAIARFVEKPDAATAERFLKDEHFAWNGGIFVFQAREMQQLFAQLAPAVATPLQEEASLEKAFERVPSISIDYAIAEKAPNMKIVPLDCGWSDVGSWDALSEVHPADVHGNVTPTATLAIEAHRNTVKAAGKTVCLIGVDDLIVIDTPDALLIAPRGQSQRVREIVAALEKQDPTLL